jgi:tetratricopeptide (TPR) repeat protein
LTDLGLIAYYRHDHGRATSLWTRSLALARALGDDALAARVLNNLGTIAMDLGEFDRAHALLSESLALHRSVGDRQGIASTLNNLAGAASRREDFETAMGYFRESHMLALAEGHHLNAAIAMEGLAALAHHHGDERVAQHRFQEALHLYRSVGDRQGIITCLGHVAIAMASQGRSKEAAVTLGAIAEICEAQNLLEPPSVTEAADVLRDAIGDKAFEAAWQCGRAMPIDNVIEQIAQQRRNLSPEVHFVS